MIGKHTSIISLAVALIISAVIGTSGIDAYKAMSLKAKAQADAVDSLREWKRQYKLLLPVEAHWNSALGQVSAASDLLTIHTLLSKDAPSSNPDTLLVEKIDRLVVDNQDLGAQSVCVTSMGRPWTVSEKSFSELLQGMQRLMDRPDIKLGTIILRQEKGRATAQISPACILLRDDDKEKTKD